MPAKIEKTVIKFIHCRCETADNKIMPNGGITIAYVLNNKFKVIGWAAAKCHAKDLYNKFLGRVKSEGRLKSSRYYQECDEMDEAKFIQNAKEGFKKNFQCLTH